MKTKTAILLSVMSITAIQTIPASAQTVIMRRPLPFSKATSGQDGCSITGNCPTPTPPSTPTPSEQTNCMENGGAGPDCPTVVTEPEMPDDPTVYPIIFNYTWDVGPWQTSGTCGSDDSKVTRTVACRSYGCSEDYSDCGYKVADPSNCTQPAPITEIRGKGVNCQYDLYTSDWSEWSQMCSPAATRTRISRCTDQTGKVVDIGYCQFDFAKGQTDETYVATSETSVNFEGCHLQWKYHYEGCSANGSNCFTCGGDPVRFRGMYYPAKCTIVAPWMGPDGPAADWTPLAHPGETDEDVCLRKGYGPRPAPDDSDLKSCNFFNNSGPMQTCAGETIAQKTESYDHGNIFQEGYAYCSSVQAGCMAIHGDPRDSDPNDGTPREARNFHISCHKGYERRAYTGTATFSEAGPAAFSQNIAPYPSLAPAYTWKKVPKDKIELGHLYHED